MAELIFYDNIVPLNSQDHQDWCLDEDAGYAFAARTNSVPLTGIEFPQAARDMPILFAKTQDQPVPVALLGLGDEENLFCDGGGQWRTGAYVPAFIRRYPFVLAEGEEEGDLTVCVDADYTGWRSCAEAGGSPLFDESGNQTEFLQERVQFLEQFHGEWQRTQQFVVDLAENGLLRDRDIQVSRPDGTSFLLRDFQVVDEEALDGLSDETVVQLYRNGYLAWLFAHVASLNNTSKLYAHLAE